MGVAIRVQYRAGDDDRRPWLEPRADEMAELLEELVAVDTENPPGRGLGRCGRAAARRDGPPRPRAELIELPPARELEEPCVVRGSVGDGPRTVYFHGHFDVVPAQRARSSGRSARRQDRRARHAPT